MKFSLIGLGLLGLLFAQDASAGNYRQSLGTQLLRSNMQQEEMSETTNEERPERPVIREDDTMRLSLSIAPDTVLTRAQFTVMIVDEFYSQAEIDNCFWNIASELPPTFTLVFTDVHVSNIYAKHICIAMRDGLVKGYADGSFHPDHTINMAEASKIISRAYVLAPFAELDTTGSWFSPYLYALTVRNAVPESITSLRQELMAKDLTEIMTRLRDGITWESSRSYDELMPRQAPVVPVQPAPSTGDTSSSAASSTGTSASSIRRSSAASQQSSSAASTMSEGSSASSERPWWDIF